MIRFYIVPYISVNQYRNAAHFGGRAFDPDPPLASAKWWQNDYGLVDVGIIMANVDDTQIAYLDTLPDILVVPEDIDSVIGARITAVKAGLNAFNIPSASISASDTYRGALREINGTFEFMQRLTRIAEANPFKLNIQLTTTFSQLPQMWKNALQQTAAELKYSTAGITGASTLLNILVSIGNQNNRRPFTMGNVEI